nr:methyltransferase domain-containing protein [Bacteroides sp. 51]
MGCGSGLYTFLFKNKGYDVTGIDFNKASIEYAAGKRNDICYIFGDYIQEYPNGKYDTVIDLLRLRYTFRQRPGHAAEKHLSLFGCGRCFHLRIIRKRKLRKSCSI